MCYEKKCPTVLGGSRGANKKIFEKVI